ncbi:DUF3040 domain-containing protein [Demequina lignilytica]|uniref:DUF3040 domain-containing protein n=1 Tax=Demequina lignilytica TaxID=3051663 RepID=A0AB35MJU3_9MICO|nr:DUF3040 domain-containing protein [Demequina sp. SYSU T0a273]MDN4483975.1 DUF3040 domain-containing protein [Demequina sp. SYSU T0a273]
MPLSEYEQRVLEQMERDLGSDPKLGSAMARASRPRSRYVWAGLGVLVGLAVVVVGAVTQLMLVGVLGFAVMLAAAVWALLAPRPHAAGGTGAGGAQAAKAKGSRRKGDTSFMNRMEQRFDKRREQGEI